MAEKRSDQIKYSILKFLDVTGFTVLDPVVRYIFREEPEKQMRKISKYIIVPILFILFCLLLWWKIAPHHKTKSGEVPTPDIVWNSAKINHQFNYREQTKASDFLLSGKSRETQLNKVQDLIQEYTTLSDQAKKRVDETEKELKDVILPAKLEPVEKTLNEYQSEVEKLQNRRKDEIDNWKKEVVAGTATRKELVAKIEEDRHISDQEKEKLKEYRAVISNIRSEKYEPLEDARKEYNALANELQFLKKREEYLTDSNRSVRVAEAKGELDKSLEDLENAETEKDIYAKAKKVVLRKESMERLESQQYASAVTVYKQIKRSIFTVLCGFLMAAMIAIPVGMMCGLNKIFMACLTPIISVFKPVSPVVWLLIFQIIVGAFFPDPDNHPLFIFFNNMPLLSSLNINPALVFSACTVAICAVWPALVNTALGVSSIDKDHINVARVLRLGFKDRLFKIIIPSSLPYVFAGLRISLGVGWMVLIAAEALSSSDGLGKFVWDEYQNGSSYSFANIIYACFVVGIIGFILDRIMIVLQRLVSFDGGQTSV
jgi:nitrate/nitrite transport system permease protein